MKPSRELILPAYLLLCLVIGGSSQAIWGNALLQVLAIGILVWAMMLPEPQPLTIAARRLFLIIGATFALFLVQLIPLPPSLWTQLPGRFFLASGFQLLGMPLPWLPISLAPYDTLASAVALLPPVAILAGMLRLRAWNAGSIFAAIGIGASISIILGILQTTGGDSSPWYFYRVTNIGVAVGAFANGNHFATLLLATIPLLGCLAAMRWRSARNDPERSFVAASAIGMAAVLVIGILINRSAAMLLLGPAVVAATFLAALRMSPRRGRQGLAAICLFLLVAGAGLVVVGKNVSSWGMKASVETRADYWTKSIQAAEDHALTGSGIGSFAKVYRGYEDPTAVDRWFVNHAHNDYLELAIEGGMPAIILLLAFLWWWAEQGRRAWSSPTAFEQKAAFVASAAILLHSLFDFPLRTAAMASVLAACLAILAEARGATSDRRDEADRPRHATL